MILPQWILTEYMSVLETVPSKYDLKDRWGSDWEHLHSQSGWISFIESTLNLFEPSSSPL